MLKQTETLLMEAKEEISELIKENIKLVIENTELLAEMNDLVDHDFFQGLTDDIMSLCCDSTSIGTIPNR